MDTVSVCAAAAPPPTQQPSSSSSGTAAATRRLLKACNASIQNVAELLQLLYCSRRCQSDVGGFVWYCHTHELAGTACA